MTRDDVDVLLITYRRPAYARLSIESLLAQADGHTRVWLWHNGDDQETLALAEGYADHPRVHRFHHSPTNERLRAPTNWIWENSEGAYVSKVDDDCLLEDGWAQYDTAHELLFVDSGATPATAVGALDNLVMDKGVVAVIGRHARRR